MTTGRADQTVRAALLTFAARLRPEPCYAS